MAYPTARSCVTNMKMGATDGGWKKYAPHRGGIVEDTTAPYRRHMSGVWHGFNESRTMCLPDGREFVNPDFDSVTPEDVENV